MNCPRCGTAPLDERERQGVTIDVCGSCRGVWLDRGELEKVLARAMNEAEALEPARGITGARRHRDDDDDDRRARRYDDDRRRWDEDDDDRGYPRRRRGVFGMLTDIFD